MNIILNGEAFNTEAGTLEELCASLGYGNSQIATALNGEFVPKAARVETRINMNDKIEILSPRQGG